MAKPAYSAIDYTDDDEKLIEAIDKAITQSAPLKAKIKNFADANLNVWKNGQDKVELKVLGQQNPKKSKIVVNRIFADVESSVPVITSNTPTPEIKNVTNDLREKLAAWLEESYETTYKMGNIIQKMVRSWYINRIGVLKYRWDEDRRFITEYVDPSKMGFDHRAKSKEDCDFIWQELESRVDILAKRFPKKKADLEKHFPKLKGNITYKEVWFSKGKYVCWAITDQKILLDKMENPNFDYGTKETKASDGSTLLPAQQPEKNLFNEPQYPYLLLNLFNEVESDTGVYDSSALIEQAAPIQNQINKMERQIADLNEGLKRTWVISGRVMSEDKAQNVVNQTGDLLMYLDRDVPEGGVQLPISGKPDGGLYGHLLHLYTEIDNIMGVHSILRGDSQRKETLGGKKMDLSQDISRMDILIRNIEGVVEQWYYAFMHMVKVYEDGQIVFEHDGKQETITPDEIPKTLVVTVKKGSTLPTDDKSRFDMALQLAKDGLMAPKDVLEELGYGKSDEIYKNLVEWLVLTGKLPPQALQAVGSTMQPPAPPGQPGQPPPDQSPQAQPPQSNPIDAKQAQIQHIQQIIQSPAFQQLPPDKKMETIQRLKALLTVLKQPTPAAAPQGAVPQQ